LHWACPRRLVRELVLSSGVYVMRVVLADLRGSRGYVNKDTIAGGYGSRFVGRTATMRWVERLRKVYVNLPSVQIGYLSGIFADAGHDVVTTRGDHVDGDLALVLTSMVDYRHEAEWADRARRHGMTAGFFGALATHVPSVLEGSGDFILQGEPEHAAMRLARGEVLRGVVASPAVANLDCLPFPRWDLTAPRSYGHASGRAFVPARTSLPLLTSRSCTEFCTYCPHRITATFRSRSPENVLEEIERDCRRYRRVHLLIRDPLFTENRERTVALAEGILARGLSVRFQCETRLDDLDRDLIDLLYRAGMRAVGFGVESVDPATLKRVGRRPIPSGHQKDIVAYCNRKGILTAGFYVIGFLDDTVASVRATLEHAVDLGSTTANFKILTPYLGTPLRRQMESLVTETDLEKFDGYTPTFRHPNLSESQLSFLLESAYARFYVRPSWLWSFLGLGTMPRWLAPSEGWILRRQERIESSFLCPKALPVPDTIPPMSAGATP
jgi:radical SAM superfamily enzyme YgiQ (UPF0313 family)